MGTSPPPPPHRNRPAPSVAGGPRRTRGRPSPPRLAAVAPRAPGAASLAAAGASLLADGYANLSTRAVAEAADVPLSQIHYHFGSKQQLIVAVLAAENARLLSPPR